MIVKKVNEAHNPFHIVVVVVLLTVALLLWFQEYLPSNLKLYSSATLAVVSVIILVVSELGRMRIKYLITETAIIKETGYVFKKKELFSIARIDLIEVKQSFWNKVFKLGHLKISVGTQFFLLNNIVNPEDLENIIILLIDKLYKPSTSKYKVPTKVEEIKNYDEYL